MDFERDVLSYENGVPVFNCARMIEKPAGRPYHLVEV